MAFLARGALSDGPGAQARLGSHIDCVLTGLVTPGGTMHLADEPIRFAARRRRVAGGLFAAVALALCGAAVTLGQGTDAPYGGLLNGCRDSRGQPYVSCVSGAVLQYAYQHPHAAGALLGYVADHGRDGGRNVDLRLLSATAHYAGMELAALPLSLGQALGDCGDAFKAACMHGFVMERLDHKPGRGRHLVRTFLRYCLPVRHDSGYYENCLHGVGHELWARTRLPLNDTLALCDPLGSPTDRSACWSGVLMEYSEGSAVKGHHSHTPAGERTLPCLSADGAVPRGVHIRRGVLSTVRPRMGAATHDLRALH